MKDIPKNVILLLAIIYSTDLWAGCNSPNGNNVTVEITKPTGDPTTTAGANTDNELTYSSGASPTVTVVCTAKEADDNLRWTIGDVGSIKAKWNPHVDGDEYTGKGQSATATYTGLPNNYDDFGKKKITLTLENGTPAADCEDETYVEIFFPRDANNHPSGNATDPNWFYYWGQVYPNNNVTYDPNYTGYAKALGLMGWSYSTAQNKNAIVFGTSHPSKYRAYGVSELFSGIDRYIGDVIHEEKHVNQITRADNLMPTSNGNDSFRFGWSWNQSSHNHWQKGPNGQWGKAGVDDDGNGTVDDARTTPAFEPGNDDDVSLDHATYAQWPKAWSLPTPNNAFHPIESEAINASDNAMNENDYSGSDWGNPGKQHKTLNKWDD